MLTQPEPPAGIRPAGLTLRPCFWSALCLSALVADPPEPMLGGRRCGERTAGPAHSPRPCSLLATSRYGYKMCLRRLPQRDGTVAAPTCLSSSC